jgi:hypothetical protein
MRVMEKWKSPISDRLGMVESLCSIGIVIFLFLTYDMRASVKSLIAHRSYRSIANLFSNQVAMYWLLLS